MAGLNLLVTGKPGEGKTTLLRGSLRLAAMPLQLSQASSCSAVWARTQNPAMQAGLTYKRLTFRDVFTFVPNFFCLVRTVCVFIFHANSPGREDFAIS